jgi:transposase
MYREVRMVEITEVLRLWRAGVPKKRIAARLGLDPKTVRRYVTVAEGTGLRVGDDVVSEMQLRDVFLALHPGGGRPRGDGWDQCRAQQEAIRRWLKDGLRLTKIRKLLVRQGVELPYPTLYRFAVLELGFGRTTPTIPVADGEPGEELQLDTGWVGWLTPIGHKRRFRAWIFTAVRSRHRFAYPTFEETTARAIDACEAAWAFFGGIFKVLIPDNTAAIVTQADPLAPRITLAFLEYAQARGFHIDPARVRHPRDKGRVERAVQTVRDDCFAGEILTTLEDARTHARHWCREDYGLRRHSRTQRAPREHFETEEQSLLLPCPTTAYEIPLWSEPRSRAISTCRSRRRCTRCLAILSAARCAPALISRQCGCTTASRSSKRMRGNRPAGAPPTRPIFPPSGASTRCAMWTPCAGRRRRTARRSVALPPPCSRATAVDADATRLRPARARAALWGRARE